MVEDVNVDMSNKGNVCMVYLNSQCQEDINNCGIDVSKQHVIADYIDFTQSSNLVNLQLNAQDRIINTGTYRYVRMDWTIPTTNSLSNVSFKGGSMGANFEFKTVNSAVLLQLPEPVQVTSGSQLGLSLSYNVDQLIGIYENQTQVGCTGTSPSYCLSLPTFIASVSPISQSS
jgi:hypothetical protein